MHFHCKLSLATLLIVGITWSIPASGQQNGDIEDALIGFSSPAEMLHPNAVGNDVRFSLDTRMAHYGIPGVSIAVINDNEISWTASYGEVSIGSGRTVDDQTIFQAASTTKLLIAVLTLQLAEKGVLKLDVDISDYLVSWTIPESSFLHEQPVTLRLLLTHQAGFNRPDGGFDKDGAPTLLQTLNGEHPAKAKRAEIEYLPGSKWQYSNYGYLIIQQVIQDVTGRTLADVAQEMIFDPLGMARSTFEVPLPEALIDNEALPHDGDGKVHEPKLDALAYANGGLRTTPTDLAKFTIALLKADRGEPGGFLSPRIVNDLFSAQVDIPPDVLGLPLQEGLGVLLSGSGDGQVFLHPGDNRPGASSWLAGMPGSGHGLIVMTNGARGNLLAMEIHAAVVIGYEWP